MDTAGNKCIWADQCGGECEEHCPDYSPIDETELNEKFYDSVLHENLEEYGKEIEDYSDEGEDMNREQRRALKKKGISQRDYAVARLNAAGVFDESKWIKDGEQVKLNVDQIMARSGYNNLQDDYKTFVEENRETVFIAQLYRKREDGFSA